MLLARCTHYHTGTCTHSKLQDITLFNTESLENDCILQIPYFELFLLFWNFDENEWHHNNLLTMNVINIQHHTTNILYNIQIHNTNYKSIILNIHIESSNQTRVLARNVTRTQHQVKIQKGFEFLPRETLYKVQGTRCIIPYTSTSICPTRIRIANLSQTWHF